VIKCILIDLGTDYDKIHEKKVIYFTGTLLTENNRKGLFDYRSRSISLKRVYPSLLQKNNVSPIKKKHSMTVFQLS